MRAAITVLCGALAVGAHAAHFRWSSQIDAISMDPHASSDLMTRALASLVYERLVARDMDGAIRPALAESWENPSPTRWVFRIREGVKFHDGSELTPDDVVFSFDRARQSGSTIRVFAAQAGAPARIDARTVEFTTPAPNPVMVESVMAVPIMSKAWCERHRVARPQDWRVKEETHAVRNAMGTGPFVLMSREPGTRTLYRRHGAWWGIAAGMPRGNVETVEHLPLENGATRLAALRSRQVDFVLDPPPQDVPLLASEPGIRIWEGSEQRVVYVGLDLAREELLHSTVKGRNPFRDRRVRLALYQAIDIEALKRQVMRGAAVPTGIALHDPAGAGVASSLKRRHPFDAGRARELLAAAGYPEGFGFTLHCPSDRMANGERICTALAAMWARIGLHVKVEAMPRSLFFPRAYKRDLSAFLMSFGSDKADAIFMLKPVLRSPGPDGRGEMNFGNASIPSLDALIDRFEVEIDPQARQALLNEAVRLMHEELPVIPLHRQMVPWASRSNVYVVHSSDNIPNLAWVRVD